MAIAAKHLPPGPKAIPLLGNILDFPKDPTGFMMKSTLEFGDTVYFWALHLKYIMVNHPEGIKHVLQENNKNYTKGIGYKPLKLFLGNGLLTTDDPSWLKHRRLIQPHFNRESIANYADVVIESAIKMVNNWEKESEIASVINISQEMIYITSQIVGKTLLSSDVGNEDSNFWRSMDYALEYVNNRTRTNPFNLPSWFPLPDNYKYAKAIRILDSFIYGVIKKRRADSLERNDLLSALLTAKDEKTGLGINDRQLRDEILTFFVAGHETSANGLTWALYLLSKHPEVQEKLNNELKTVLDGRTPNFMDLHSLTYTMQVIQESLRLYPPVWIMGRQTIKEDSVRGHYIPPHTDIMISPYVLHRHPDYWKDPDVFDPDRFSPENVKNHIPYAYIPFGGGPRLCVGQNFALMEMVLVLAIIAQKYSVKLTGNQNVELGPYITLRPKEDLMMKLVRRNQST